MEIDWFWLSVICGIAGLTITTCFASYFRHKYDSKRFDSGGAYNNNWKKEDL
jgi:hypothetical protein